MLFFSFKMREGKCTGLMWCLDIEQCHCVVSVFKNVLNKEAFYLTATICAS